MTLLVKNLFFPLFKQVKSITFYPAFHHFSTTDNHLAFKPQHDICVYFYANRWDSVTSLEVLNSPKGNVCSFFSFQGAGSLHPVVGMVNRKLNVRYLDGWALPAGRLIFSKA